MEINKSKLKTESRRSLKSRYWIQGLQLHELIVNSSQEAIFLQIQLLLEQGILLEMDSLKEMVKLCSLWILDKILLEMRTFIPIIDKEPEFYTIKILFSSV